MPMKLLIDMSTFGKVHHGGKEEITLDITTGTIIMILCFDVGSGLVVLEAFIPGFGAAGIAGVLLEIAAVVLTNAYYGLFWSVIGALAALLFIGIAVFCSYRSAMNGRLNRSPLILKETEAAEAPSAPAAAEWLEQEGVTVTSLRPAGMIEIGGKRLNASTAGEFLARGTAVRVTGAEGDHVTVRKIEA